VALSARFAINDAGQVVGESLTTGGYFDAFLYSGGVMTDLGTLGGAYAYANAISEDGNGITDAANLCDFSIMTYSRLALFRPPVAFHQ
jgi:probable HAF family extracellular repeat protein